MRMESFVLRSTGVWHTRSRRTLALCRCENKKRDQVEGEGMCAFVVGADVADKEDKSIR